MTMTMRKEEEEEEEGGEEKEGRRKEDELRQKSNNPNLKGGEQVIFVFPHFWPLDVIDFC